VAWPATHKVCRLCNSSLSAVPELEVDNVRVVVDVEVDDVVRVVVDVDGDDVVRVVEDVERSKRETTRSGNNPSMILVYGLLPFSCPTRHSLPPSSAGLS